MKKYSVCNLKVVKVENLISTRYLICRYNNLTNQYIDVLTGEKIRVENEEYVKPLEDYCSVLGNNPYGLPGNHEELTEKDILYKLIEINKGLEPEEEKSSKIKLEKAPADGYVPSDEEYEILKKMGVNKSFVDSIEADRTLVYNPQHFPELYLSSEDYDRIYKNIVGDVLDKIPSPEENSKQVQTNTKLTELSEELKKAKDTLVQLCETNPEEAKQLAIEVLIKTGVIETGNDIEKAQILVKKKQK